MHHAPLTIRLFGPPEFRVNGELLPRLKTRKGLYVLALLALRHDREIERSWLAGILWPENEEATALAYLRQSLTDLRHALGDAAGCLLSPTSRTLRLDVDNADVDLISFGQSYKRGDTESLEQAIGIYRGPLLEGWAEDWLLAERETYAQSYLAALETRARQVIEADDARDAVSAIRYLRLILASDPLRESACRSLMQALATTHDFAAVTQAYRDLRTAVRRELNTEPGPETQALFARLRADARRLTAGASSESGKTAEPSRTPQAEGETNRPVSLPRPISEFIGRRTEVEIVRRTLSTSRLVTLTGIGGVGKTRLAIRVAEEVADDFPDGIHFVGLSSIADPALLAKAVASVLGIPEQAKRPLTDTLCESLHERQLLLILDNCEHVLDEGAHFAAALLQKCPRVRILATSQQRLGISGETVRRVPPLTLPDLKQLAADEKNAAAALVNYEAVRLFVDRAQRVNPNLHLDPPTLRSIATICNRLDGIPLALELAAARMSALGPEQIAVRLAQRLRLLSSSNGAGSGGDRSAPARQRTLRAALDWSHDLLSAEERLLLRRLSVFAGGWTLEAAEAVCAGKMLDEWEVMDCLTGLVDHSLVVVETESMGASPRYRLLETVREYAQEQLREHTTTVSADDETAWLRVKHREYLLELVREAEPHLVGSDPGEWLNRLEREHDNLRAALDGCLEEENDAGIQAGLEFAGELRQFWMQRGHAGEGRRRYAVLLARDISDPTPARARVLEGAGVFAYRQGDYAAAKEMMQEALTIHRRHGNQLAEAIPLSVLGQITYLQGDYPAAREILEQALVLRRAAGNRAGEAAVLNSLGNIAVRQGEPADARGYYEQALVIGREIGDHAMEASILNGLGMLAANQEDFPNAGIWFEQALARNHEIGDCAQMMVNLYNLANVRRRLGKQKVAEDHFRQALLLANELGESRSRRSMALLFNSMAMLARDDQNPERAARLIGAADAQREAISLPIHTDDQEEYDQLLADLRTALGEKSFTSLWDEGHSLTTDQAISLALEC